MTGFEDAGFYGERWAQVYDPIHWDAYPEPAVEFLAELAPDGSALEFGIGTGRVALPLARAGLRVQGVDVSEPMVRELRAKPGADAVAVTMADWTTLALPDRFDLVYMVFNGIFCALTPAEQVATLRSAARHLAPGGAVVLECFVPDPGRFDRGQRVHILELSEDVLIVEYSVHDPVAQRINTQMVNYTGGRADLGPLAIRYAWPSELDLMAELAGLRLDHRYGDWDARPFDAGSTKHVSVYRAA